MATETRLEGSATIYRLYDIGYAIDLDRAAEILGDRTRGRVRPARSEARAIEIRNPPLFVSLGSFEVVVGNEAREATLAARLFDFGVCSLQLRIPVAPGTSPTSLAEFGRTLDAGPGPATLLDKEVRSLLERITGCVERPAVAPLSEEYKVFRIDRILDGAGEKVRQRRCSPRKNWWRSSWVSDVGYREPRCSN